VVAVGAAVVVCVAAVGQSGLVTTTVAGTATAADRQPVAGANITTTAGAARTTRPATAAEEVGVVDITSVLDYGSAEAAGTGVVLTPSGEILTNNHVIDGATKITATVVATGRSYAAAVVGTDPGDDVRPRPGGHDRRADGLSGLRDPDRDGHGDRRTDRRR
jgi:S1-C subfamily serine protease